MDSDELTQCTQNTQGVMDPRRLGRQNSGLSPEDSSDVMCILHPSTPAAFELVAATARRAPHHILQHVSTPRIGFDDNQSMVEEQETFILDFNSANEALDLAFRFSSPMVSPHLGFTFGRNMTLCDIAPSSDTHKRVSNLHFTIYLNESGVLMIKDMSTNGTMVDEILLKGKTSAHPVTRMLSHGSIIQILTERPEEALKFIVRIPPRGEFEEEYKHKFRVWIDRKMDAEVKEREKDNKGLHPDDAQNNRRLKHEQRQADVTQLRVPLLQNHFGMHWDGGQKYNVVGQIGKGAFASVYQLATKSHGQLFAAKELEKRRFMKNGVLDRKLENEMLIMQDIDHPSIVQYYEYQDAANHLYIIMEFVECGDLQQYLSLYGPLSEGIAKQMAAQVFDALDYLHKKRITHRDIKPDNILLASVDPEHFVIKLSDFGLSKVVKDNDTFLKTFCGTLLYCAPEVFPHYDAHVSGKGAKRPRHPPSQPPAKFHSYSHAVDIWSFGAVLWYSLCQKPPFEGVADSTGRGMFDKIMMTPLDTSALEKKGISTHAVALLVEMLNTNPALRPSAEACLRHDWLGGLRPTFQRQPELALGAIAEEVEAEFEGVRAPDFEALSLDERQQQDSHYSEVSLNSEDLNFFDPRKSKRFKASSIEHRENNDGDMIDSSPELFESIPIMHEHQQGQDAAAHPKPPKLFGEISQSDLQTSAFGKHANDTVGNHGQSLGSSMKSDSGNSHRSAQQISHGQSGSLQGAEELVREMNVDSPHSHLSANETGSKPATPPSGYVGQVQGSPTQAPSNTHPEVTPRPVHNPNYHRNIQILLPPSFFFDANDPATHNVEYATKVSGRDFVTDPAYTMKDPSDASLLDTRDSSRRSGTDEGHEKALAVLNDGTTPVQEISARPLYGRLISTPDSTDLNLALHHQITTFGRSRKATYIWPDQTDVRIGKDALTIFFGTDKLVQSQEVVNLEKLYCNILTHGSNGVVVNGVALEKDTPSRHSYGRIYTGDEIEVCKEFRDKKPLKFIVQINIGLSKVRRPRHGPNAKFRVLHDSPCTSQTKTSHEATPAAAGAEVDPDVL